MVTLMQRMGMYIFSCICITMNTMLKLTLTQTQTSTCEKQRPYKSILGHTTRVLVSQTLSSLSKPLEMNIPVSCGYHWTVCTLYLCRSLLDRPTEQIDGNVHCGTPSVFVTSCMTITPSAPPDNKLKHKQTYYHSRKDINYGLFARLESQSGY